MVTDTVQTTIALQSYGMKHVLQAISSECTYSLLLFNVQVLHCLVDFSDLITGYELKTKDLIYDDPEGR